MDLKLKIGEIVNIAIGAGDIIMKYYNQHIDVILKTDNTPVTVADIAANDYITESLRALYPSIPVISEENNLEDNKLNNDSEYFWLVDPIDGTKGFINNTGEFTVNIALVYKGEPYAGVIYSPTLQICYHGVKDKKAYKLKRYKEFEEIKSSLPPQEGATIIASLDHRNRLTDEYIKTIKAKSVISVSSSIKFCMLAEGIAHIYPRLGSTTMEWDIAAGHAILNAAGGSIKAVDGSEIKYGTRPDFSAIDFVAYGGKK